MNTTPWDHVLLGLRAAVASLLTGDPVPYQRLWSHAADACMMGAYGGLALGHEAVQVAIARAANNYQGWKPGYHEELIAAGHEGPLGYLILRERVTNQHDGTVRSRRVTVLFRREAGGWWIFHHHSDPLHDLGPRGDPQSREGGR